MRVAAFQQRPIFDDPDAAADRLVRDLLWADDQGVELALFPECSLLGHSYEQVVIEKRAIRADDEIWQTLLTRLQPISTAAILGFFERGAKGITNTAALVEGGRITGRYAKAHPNEAGVEAGNNFPVFSRASVTFGINICHDANFSEPAKRLADQGATLICYLLNNIMQPATAEVWRTRSVDNLKARARQTRCWIMSADVVGEVDGRVSHGCTTIIRPDGMIVARIDEGAEGAAVYDLPGMLQPKERLVEGEAR
jgi:predicted amidohydrolase